MMSQVRIKARVTGRVRGRACEVIIQSEVGMMEVEGTRQRSRLTRMVELCRGGYEAFGPVPRGYVVEESMEKHIKVHPANPDSLGK